MPAPEIGWSGAPSRRTTQHSCSALMATYGQDNFFLLHLIDGQDQMDLPDHSTFTEAPVRSLWDHTGYLFGLWVYVRPRGVSH
jgi:hypothetical protein